MITFKDYTENYTCFTYTLLRFKSQTKVIYDTPVADIRLSKSDLIVCIKYILFRLSQIGYIDKINHGFALDKFKYYELSTYLHGLLVVYSGILDVCPPTKLSIKRFSRLPHEVLKLDKDTKDIQVFLFDDICGCSQYCSVVNGRAIYSPSFIVLQRLIKEQCPSLFVKYNIRFIIQNDLPF